MAPRYFNTSGLIDLAEKPPILWVHGTADAIVSDASYFDLNHLGAVGIVPGWPGADVAPAQEMVAQTRDVLDAYRAAGGAVTEVSLDGVGHAPPPGRAPGGGGARPGGKGGNRAPGSPAPRPRPGGPAPRGPPPGGAPRPPPRAPPRGAPRAPGSHRLHRAPGIPGATDRSDHPEFLGLSSFTHVRAWRAMRHLR